MKQYAHIVIGMLTLAGIVAVLVIRPNSRRLNRWVLEHKSLIDAAAPFVFILWGGVIWALLILKGDFSKVLTMVMASLLICIGVFFYFKRF